MTEPQRDSAHFLFMFAYTNRRPRDKSDILKLPAVRQQIGVAEKQGYSLSGARLGIETSRRRHFAATRSFADALQASQQLGQPLVLPSIEVLLSRTPPKLIQNCVDHLLSLGDAVIDATHGTNWATVLAPRIVGIVSQSRERSWAIRSGLSGNSKVPRARSEAQKDSFERANSIRLRTASRRAEMFRPFVEALARGLPVGESLAPTSLAKALNEAGHLSPHGKPWSPNSARNLLRLLEGQVTTSTSNS